MEYWTGYVNVDSDPTVRADLRIDFNRIHEHFRPGTVTEVVMIHSLNYLSLWQARDVFAILHGLLAPGGRLVFETVNLESAARKILENEGKDLGEYLEGVRALHAFGKVHHDNRKSYVPNSFSWTPWHLKLELEHAGFREVRILPATSHVAWRDMRVEAVKASGGGAAALRSEAPAVRSHAEVAAPEMRGSVLFVVNRVLGAVTANIRGFIYRDLFERNGWRVEFLDIHEAGMRKIVECSKFFDAVYLMKVPYPRLVRELKKHVRAKVIFDLTDALWKPAFRRAGWGGLEEILRTVDAVFSENEAICAFGRGFNQNVFGIPACTQVELFDRLRGSVPPRGNGGVVVGWIGSPSTVGALEKVRGVLENLSARHPGLRLRVVGCGDVERIPRFRNVRWTALSDYDEETMVREALSMDIGIFPAPSDSEDYAIRGALKGMIYMTAGIPAVCQNAGECARIIRDGVNGMLAGTEREWEEKLEALIVTPELRRRIGEQALRDIREEHSREHVFRKLEEALLAVIFPKPGAA